MQLSFKKYLIIVFLFFVNYSYSQDFSPTLGELQSSFENGATEKSEQQLLGKIKLLENRNSSPLLLSRHYNLLGKIYHSLYDIGIAYKYWNKSLLLIKNNYGANTIYLAENYSLLAKYYSFRIVKDSALFFANKALMICWDKKDSLAFVPVNDIYREFGYNSKIVIGDKDFLGAREKARIYFDSSLYYNNKYFHDNNSYKGKIFHDIGNTYTDEALYYKEKITNPFKAKESLEKANKYYNKELAIYSKISGNKSEKIANIYFAKALGNEYAYKYDSVFKSLDMLHKALIALTPNYDDANIFSSPSGTSNFLNKPLATILLSYKAELFSFLYDKTKDKKYIEAAYNHSLLEANLWEELVKSLNTFEVHQALDTYMTGLQNQEIPVAEKYYRLTKSNIVKNNLLKWIDYAKYASVLKQELQSNSHRSITAINISEVQKRLKDNDCIINQYFEDNQYICTYISKNKSDVMPLFLSKHINQKSDSLLYFLKRFNEKNYCRTAKWLYDTLLSETIKLLPSQVTHLIIIPQNNLSQIPYEALLINSSNTYSKADFLINHYSVSYGLSINLLMADSSSTLRNSISYLAPDFQKHTQLPFSKQLSKYLEKNFTLSSFKSIASSTNNILHLATHAYCDRDESRNSYLLLSDNDSAFFRDFYAKNLNYKLAVISACETANGREEKGEGTINFNRSLYLAGIKNAITSLWKIDDKSSAQILKHFYSNLFSGETSSEALSHAKRQYMQNVMTIDDRNPIYWAGLVYTGNDLVLEKERNQKSVLYLLLGIALVICCFILIRKFRS